MITATSTRSLASRSACPDDRPLFFSLYRHPQARACCMHTVPRSITLHRLRLPPLPGLVSLPTRRHRRNLPATRFHLSDARSIVSLLAPPLQPQSAQRGPAPRPSAPLPRGALTAMELVVTHAPAKSCDSPRPSPLVPRRGSPVTTWPSCIHPPACHLFRSCLVHSVALPSGPVSVQLRRPHRRCTPPSGGCEWMHSVCPAPQLEPRQLLRPSRPPAVV